MDPSNPNESSPFNLVVDTGSRELEEPDREYIDTRIEKIERWTRKFPQRSCHISMQVSDRDGMHRCIISLKLPQVNLAGKAEEPHLRAAFDRANKRLVRQLNEFKHVMRRDHMHQRARDARRELAPLDSEEIVTSVTSRDSERFRKGLGRHVDSLREMISCEVEEIRCSHPEVEVTVDELVEAILDRAIDHQSEKPAGMGGRNWLFQTAIDLVDERFPRSRKSRANARRTASPSSAWRVFEDEPVDPESDAAATEAAQMLGTDQLRAVVEEMLAALPRDWRRAFRMHYVDGLDTPEIAELLDLDVEQTSFRLRGAAEFLRDHLEELRGSA